jgi:hypothetical protein
LTLTFTVVELVNALDRLKRTIASLFSCTVFSATAAVIVAFAMVNPPYILRACQTTPKCCASTTEWVKKPPREQDSNLLVNLGEE